MTAIPYITDADIDQQRAPSDLVAAIRARRANGKLLNLDRMLLHSPPIARGWNVFMGSIRRDLAVSPLLREIAICAVAKLNRAEYEWYQHAPELLAAGGTEAQLDAMQQIDEAPHNVAAFNEIERVVLKLTEEMTLDIEVQPATMAALRIALPDREVSEIVGVIASYNMVSRYLVALGVNEKGE
ncbi:MAG: carboxymuconolactone decarboxylase family protein [Usitatibacteraceae bacterium]